MRGHNILTLTTTREAEQHLSRVDRKMAKLIVRYGRCPIYRRRFLPFHVLVKSIISQQLSSRASDTIEKRLSIITPVPFDASNVNAVSISELRSAGLSKAKASYILNLSNLIMADKLLFSDMKLLSNDEIIDQMVTYPGVGRWTAEMFLIFGLKRSDVLSLGDVGLRRAVCSIYQSSAEDAMSTLSSKWRPYCSVASWYLWKHLDVVA